MIELSPIATVLFTLVLAIVGLSGGWGLAYILDMRARRNSPAAKRFLAACDRAERILGEKK